MIEIFLSVYNGEEYLEKQLDSLLSQDYGDIIITVRDDGSTDRSAEIIGRYIEKYPRKIRRITTHTNSCTESTSFSELMKNAIIGDNNTCYAFCGRGEIWKPHKLTKEMEKMLVLRQTEGFHTPKLVCTDGEKGTEILSVSAYKNLRNDKFTLKQALAECPIIGGSCLIDGAMLSLCANITENVDYDWWIVRPPLHSVLRSIFPSNMYNIRDRSKKSPKAAMNRQRHFSKYLTQSSIPHKEGTSNNTPTAAIKENLPKYFGYYSADISERV